MIPFSSAIGAESVFLIILTVLSFFAEYIFLICIINKYKFRYTVINVFIVLLIICKILIYSENFRSNADKIFHGNIFYRFMHVPLFIHVIFLVFEIILVFFDLYKIMKWQKNNISLRTVKEASDKLPMGLCYYNENGLPLLINHKMNSISRILTGEALLDGNEFWNKISTGDVLNGSRAENSSKSPIIEFSNGNVRSFTRTEKIINGEKIFEIIAADITAQFMLSRKLKEYNEDISRINRKLEQHSENLLFITREREILAAKISIHDSLGKVLLATKRYAENGGTDETLCELLTLWRDNINLLKNENSGNENECSLDDLYDAARIMGIKVSVKGDIPYKDSRIMRVMMSGARECLTNAVRHAGAENLFINISEKASNYVIDFTNDGMIPENDIIKEGGGLSFLRKTIEKDGGNMRIYSRPEFRLEITIPK